MTAPPIVKGDLAPAVVTPSAAIEVRAAPPESAPRPVVKRAAAEKKLAAKKKKPTRAK